MKDELIIKSLKSFEKKASKVLSRQSLEELYDFLYENPNAGAIIKGTGGIRKLRWKTGKSNKGKSGGVRIIYYHEKGFLIILLSIYSKSEKDNLTDGERNQLKKLLPQIIRQTKGEI